MKITLISHASVIIETEDRKIWTDPWLFGTAFNDSWALNPQASQESVDYSSIDHIWISHEHPDHFHIPTLRSLPEAFKESVIVLYQDNNSNKMIQALEKFGFRNFIRLPNRKIVSISDRTKVYCYQVGAMDSALGILSDSEVVLNINDCEFNSKDCSIVRSDIGQPDVVLNQFSIAGYSGQASRAKYLPPLARKILQNCSENHRDLSAKVTIPFASLVYFCQADNSYINEYHNSPLDFCKHMDNEGLDYILMYPGDVYSLSQSFCNSTNIEKYSMIEGSFEASMETAPTKTLREIENAFRDRFVQISRDHSRFIRILLKPVTVYIADLSKSIKFCFKDGTFEEINVDEACDLDINSQPLWFGFKFPFGIQTLGVSARYTLNKNEKNWKYHRILFSLNNAEIYLSHKFFNRSNLKWLASRFSGLVNQLFYQLKRM